MGMDKIFQEASKKVQEMEIVKMAQRGHKRKAF